MKKLVVYIVVLSLVASIICVPINTVQAAISNLSTTIDQTTRIVKITGNNDSGPGSQVIVRVKNPNGVVDYVNQVSCIDNGKFEFVYKLTNPLGGTYQVDIGGTGITTPQNTSFICVAPTATPTAVPTAVPSSGGGGGGGGGGGSTVNVDNILVNDIAKALQEAMDAYSKVSPETLKKITNELINKAGTITVKPEVKNNTATVSIFSSVFSELTSTADVVSKTVDAVREKVDVPLGKRVVLDIKPDPKAPGYDTAKIEMSKYALELVSEQKVEVIHFNLGIATVAVPPDFITDVAVKQLELSFKVTEENGSTVIYAINNLTTNGGPVDISKFAKPVEISVPYTLKTNEDKESITVMCIAEDGSKTDVSGSYIDTENGGRVSFTTDYFGKFIVANIEKPKPPVESKTQVSNEIKSGTVVTFEDIQNHWSKSYVEAMASKGYINGRNEKTFDPQGTITRAEFTALVTRLMNVVDKNAVTDFKDVNKDAWYYENIASAVKTGIIKEADSFKPEEYITREDMAAMVATVLQAINKEQLPTDDTLLDMYNDKNEISADLRFSVALCVKTKMINGKSDITIDPKGTATRAEAATIIYRLHNYQK